MFVGHAVNILQGKCSFVARSITTSQSCARRAKENRRMTNDKSVAVRHDDKTERPKRPAEVAGVDLPRIKDKPVHDLR